MATKGSFDGASNTETFHFNRLSLDGTFFDLLPLALLFFPFQYDELFHVAVISV